MAAHTGNLLPALEAESVATHGNVAFGSKPEVFDHLSLYDPTLNVFGEHASTQPITDEREKNHDGAVLGEYGYLDFYFRIHIQYDELNLGAVVNDQEVPFYVFNGHLSVVTLEDAGFTGDSGITLALPHGDPPVEFTPLEAKTYHLNVDGTGPAVIVGNVTIEFDVQALSMSVTGIRVLAWRWSPNWDYGVRERLQWVTDVHRSYNASEQRRALREYPRQHQEFTFDVDDKEQRILENTLYTWGARLWVVPFWPDVQHLSADLADGEDVIPLDTTTRQFEVGKLVMLVSPDDDVHEALEVAEINSDSVELVQPTSRAWPAGTLVYPARLHRLEDAVGLARFIRSHTYGVVSFVSYEGVPYETLTESTYRGYPVLTVEPNQDPDPSTQYARKSELVDFMVGLSTVDDESQVPDIITSHNRVALERTEIDELRKFLYSRAGRAKGLWVPSFTEDLILTSAVTAVATTIDFVHAGLADLAQGGMHKRDIRIELRNGTVLYRRLSSPTRITDDIERMSLDSPLGVAIDPADVKLISWMVLSRLDSDEIEILWTAPHVAEAMTVFRSYNNDV